MKKQPTERIAHSCCRTLAVLAAALCVCGAFAPAPSYADLPAGYRLLDYVDTDGNQWVNTLFRPSCTNAVEIKASILNKLSTSQFLYCSRKTTSKTSTDKRFYSLCIASSKPRFDYGNEQSSGNTLTLGETYVFSTSPSVDADQEEVDEASKTWTQTGSGNGMATVASQTCFTANTDSYFCLFAGYAGSLNDNTSPEYKTRCRFWYFKVWDTKDKENLLCHIVPVYSEVHAAVGLYDLVAERFLPVHGNPFSTVYSLTDDDDMSDEATMLSSNVTVDLAGHTLSAPTTVTKSESSTVAGDGYQDLDYVTAAGAQSVTIPDFRLPGTAKVEMKIRPYAFPTTATLFMSRTGATSNTFTSFIYGDAAKESQKRRIRFDLNDNTTDGTTALTVDRDSILVFDGSNLCWSVDGVIQNINTDSNDFTSGCDLRLLNLNAGSIKYPAYSRLYYFTVTTNGTTVALDLHPVRRISDGVVGLYDTVGGTFYESERSAFPDTSTPVFTNSAATASELLVGQKMVGGYTVLDCITTTTRSPYIDTEFVPASTDRIELTASVTSSGGNYGLFCTRDSSAYNAMNAVYSTSDTLRFDFNKNKQITTTYAPGSNVLFTVALDGNTQGCYGDGNLLHTFTVGNDFTPSANLFIFALQKGGSNIGYHPSGSIYSFKVTGADGTLKVDMVPVVRNSDSVAGLYDRIRQRFFPSSNSTAFTAGTQAGDGILYVDADSAFDATSIAANIALVKNGDSAFDGRGTTLAGTLRPVAGTIGGVVLQNGATLDLSARSDSFSLDDNDISFADSASITIDVGSRTFSSRTALVSWTTAPENIATLKFVRAAGASRGFVVKSDGIYPAPSGIAIIFR